MSRPSDSMQPAGKRRPGAQLTKDNYDESDDEGQAVDPGTWGKADAATMAKRKVIKVRRGAGAVADQPEPAAAAGSNPFSGVSLAGAAAAPAGNPFAGISMAASTSDKAATKQPTDQQAVPSPSAADAAAAQQPAGVAAEETAEQEKPPEPAPASASRPTAAADDATPPEDKAAGTQSEAAGQQAQQEGQQTAGEAGDSKADDKANGQPAAAATAAASSTGGLFGSAGTSGFGGFGGFGGLAAGSTGFGGGGFGGFAAAAAKDGSSGGSLFGSYTAPQPGSLFGSVPAFGAAGAGKGKDVEEGGGDGGEGADENGQEVFGGPEVAPVVQLNEVPKQTGEEDENSVFTVEGKLYEFVDGKDWKERGRGDLRLNVHRGTHRARLVMRQKGSQRLLLNANLYPRMNTSKMVGGKGATFSAVNAAPPVPGEDQGKADKQEGEAEAATDTDTAGVPSAASMKTYAFKAKSADEIDAFLSAVNKYKEGSGDDATGEADAGKQANPDTW